MLDASQLTSTLPADTTRAIKPNSACSDFERDRCDSRSLMLDRYAQPQLKEEERRKFFQNAIGRKALTERCKSWDALLPKLTEGGSILYAQVQSRLLVNVAGGVMENAGLCLDRFGMPYIPGSAVKGCARRMAIQQLMEMREEGKPPGELANVLADVVLVFGMGTLDWLDDKRDGNPVSDLAWALGVQEAWQATKTTVIKRLLEYLNIGRRSPGNPSGEDGPDLAGRVGFLPAYPVDVPVNGLPIPSPKLGQLELDVLTCHHPDYYRCKPDVPRAFDDELPIPVVFPAVAPGHVFAFVVVPLRGIHRSFSRRDKSLQALAQDWLADGLSTFGLGAKTAAGYGWFAVLPETGNAIEKQRQARAADEQKQRDAQAERERRHRDEEKKRLEREALGKATAGMSEEEKELFLIRQNTDDQLRSKLAQWNDLRAPEKFALYQLLRGERVALWREILGRANDNRTKNRRWRSLRDDLFKMAKDRKEKMPS